MRGRAWIVRAWTVRAWRVRGPAGTHCISAGSALIWLGLISFGAGCARFGYDLSTLDSTSDDSTAGNGGAPANGAGPCPSRCANSHGSARCEGESCLLDCAIGYSDCDADSSNGCEVDSSTSTASCGACGVTCANAHGATQCVSGLCTPICDPGYGDCDGDPGNGCERALDTTLDCGGCGIACGTGNAVTTCADNRCSPTCAPGYDDCDGDPTNGCEVDVRNDPRHCGGCLGSCDVSAQICADGRCVASPCGPGLGDCDGDSASICETIVSSSVAHCGFCGNACSVANGAPSCDTGLCGVQSCNDGFGDCDRVASNGCEAALASNAAHCGACGQACSNDHGTTSCSGSVCVPSCGTGYGDCDASRENGCETALDTVEHCGGCGNVCPANDGQAICSAGVCGTRCDLSGTFALKMSMTGSWPQSTNVNAGGGTFHFWLKAVTLHAGDRVTATVTECGRFMPEIVNRVGEGLIHGYPDALFDAAILPSSDAAFTLSSSSPGATLDWPLTANQMGIALPNPKTDAWPGQASSIPSAMRIDMDQDGKPGVTGTYATGETFPRTSAAVFGFNRADIPYFAARVAFSLRGTLDTCSRSSGVATMGAVDLRIFGCNRADSTQDCSSTEGGFVDANTPNVSRGAASYVLQRLPDGSNCAAVRAAL